MTETEKQILKDFLFNHDEDLFVMIQDFWEDYFDEEPYYSDKAIAIVKHIIDWSEKL